MRPATARRTPPPRPPARGSRGRCRPVGALEQVAAGACPHRREDRLVVVVHGQDEDRGPGLRSTIRRVAPTPSSPGMARSVSTTSGRVRRPRRAARRRRRPRRPRPPPGRPGALPAGRSGTSGGRRRRPPGRRSRCLPGQGKPGHHGGPPSGAGDVERPPHLLGAVPHRRHPDPALRSPSKPRPSSATSRQRVWPSATRRTST